MLWMDVNVNEDEAEDAMLNACGARLSCKPRLGKAADSSVVERGVRWSVHKHTLPHYVVATQVACKGHCALH